MQNIPENRWGVWLNGSGNFGDVGDDSFSKGYRFTTGAVAAGVDYRALENFAVGLFGGYAHTWTELRPGHIDIDTGRGGLYGTYFGRNYYLNGAVFGGYNSYDTRRQALAGTATGSTDGEEFSTFLETAYNYRIGNFQAGPVAALQFTYVKVNGFTEQSSLMPLQIHSDSQNSLRTDLGWQASYSMQAGNILISPFVRAVWEHEFKYSALPVTVSTALFPGVSATVYGPTEGHDSAIVNAGLGVQLTPRITVYAGYLGQLGREHFTSHAVTGGLSFGF
jgi:outer membrane autotransporter protein